MNRESFIKDIPKNITSSHIRSKKQEKEWAKRINGRLTPGSGSGRMKGDVRKNKIIRIECKTTSKDYFRVTKEMLRKIEDAALPFDEAPCLIVEFNDGNGNKVGEVAIFPTYILDRLLLE